MTTKYVQELAKKSNRSHSRFELPDDAKKLCREVWDAIQSGEAYVARLVLARDIKERFSIPLNVKTIDEHIKRLWDEYAQR